jgi:hypothetical protein
MEKAGLPHYSVGSSVVKELAPGASKLLEGAIKRFRQVFNRAPTAEEISQLEQHAASFSKPAASSANSMLKTPEARESAAAYQLAKDPNLLRPDDLRDPFTVRQVMPGRTKANTSQKPITQDVHATPNVEAEVSHVAEEVPHERTTEYGLADEGMHPGSNPNEDLPVSQSTWAPSSTPSADFFAQRSAALERDALGQKAFGKDQRTVYDMLKDNFVQATGRNPTQEEFEQLVSQYNPARHPYTPSDLTRTESGEGLDLLGNRPSTARGMEDWRQANRDRGVSEYYLQSNKNRYPQEFNDALEILHGNIPATKSIELKPRQSSTPDLQPLSTHIDENGNLVHVYPEATHKAEGGHMTPDEMRHMMIAYGHEPQHFKEGSLASLPQDYSSYIPKYSNIKDAIKNAGSVVASHPAVARVGKGLGVANKWALEPAFRGLNAYGVYEDANNIYDRLNRGDYRGAAISGVGAAGNIAAMRAGIPGAVLGTGVSYGADALNDYLDRTDPYQGKSVLEGTKLKDFE